MMLQIKERQVARDTPVGCGHIVVKGDKAYTLTFVVCAQEAACMYLTVRASFQALKEQSAWQPSRWYTTWHKWFGKKKQKGGEPHE